MRCRLAVPTLPESTKKLTSIPKFSMEQQKQTPNFRLIEIIEDGSAKTFNYSNPEENNNSSFFARLEAKIQQILRVLHSKNREKNKTQP